MKKGWLVLIAFVVVIIIAVMWFSGKYNTLVSLEEGVNQAWSQVENQYQRRADLVPNLVNTVKGAADFEQGTFTAVTEARAKVGQLNVSSDILNNPQAFRQFQNAQSELSSALSRLLVVSENYPQLRATENFRQLQAQLEGTENRISVERRKFNQTVQDYNTKIRQFPTAMIAGMFGFEKKQYFEAQPGSETAPEVKF